MRMKEAKRWRKPLTKRIQWQPFCNGDDEDDDDPLWLSLYISKSTIIVISPDKLKSSLFFKRSFSYQKIDFNPKSIF